MTRPFAARFWPSITAPDADALDLAEELALLDEPMPIKRETCLALEPTTRGVWPAVCNEPYEHRGPHCSRRGRLPISMSNQVVSAVTWESATEQGQGQPQGANVGPDATVVIPGPQQALSASGREVIERWTA